jgi:acyl carrier protein
MGSPRKQVELVVRELLVQFVGGDKDVSLDDKPISGLGLSSLDGVDFACELEKKLGCSIPSKLNPFVADGADGERNVSQIVDVISTLCSATESK